MQGMGLFTWIIIGLIAGALAKFLMKGKAARAGMLTTIILGMAGALIGGYAGQRLNIGDTSGLNVMSLILATAGAVALLFLYKLIRK